MTRSSKLLRFQMQKALISKFSFFQKIISIMLKLLN